MRSWPVQEAKARFSELLNACEREGAQIVTRRGVETAVLAPIEEWRRLSGPRPSLKDLLLSPDGRGDFDLVDLRGKARHRSTPEL